MVIMERINVYPRKRSGVLNRIVGFLEIRVVIRLGVVHWSQRDQILE